MNAMCTCPGICLACERAIEAQQWADDYQPAEWADVNNGPWQWAGDAA